MVCADTVLAVQYALIDAGYGPSRCGRRLRADACRTGLRQRSAQAEARAVRPKTLCPRARRRSDPAVRNAGLSWSTAWICGVRRHGRRADREIAVAADSFGLSGWSVSVV